MDLQTRYTVPIQNRFGNFTAREMDDQTMVQPMCANRQDFVSSSMEDKLVHMFDELRYIRNEQVNCTKGMLYFQKHLVQVDQKVGHVIKVTNSQTALIRALAYKSIDMEARSR